jgi:ATP-binding cassette subfamily B multidrug efflux pump
MHEKASSRTSILRFYLWKYRRFVILGLLTLALVDFLELVPPLILKAAIDHTVQNKPFTDLLVLAGAYFLTLFFQGVGRWGWRTFLIRSSYFAGSDIRNSFVEHLFKLSPRFYDKHRVGELMAHATGDVESIRHFLGSGFLIFADALLYIVSVPIAMYWLSPKLTLLVMIPLPIIPFIVFKLENLIHERYTQSQNHFSELSAMAQEALNGVRVTKAFAKENIQQKRFEDLGQEYVRLNLRLARVQSSFGPLMDFFTSIGLVLLVIFGGQWVATDAVTLGTFVAFQRYIQKMVWPMMGVGFAVSFYQRALASSDRLKKIFQIEPEIDDQKVVNPVAWTGIQSQGDLEFKNLNFRFPSDIESPWVLKNINLKINSGERVAFIGRVGSGKSALLGLIPRLYQAPDRTIFLDGTPIEEWPLAALRTQIGFVSQDVFLFSDTVFENVNFGQARNNETPQSRFDAAMGVSQMAEELSRFTLGQETLLGERGVNLSGGQKQRMTLARAIALQPPILILDDALSSVDVKTEAAVLAQLRLRKGRNTELIAAHRISTVKDADRIMVMHQGEIVDQGTHDDLIQKRSGIYYQFYEQQRLKEDLEHFLAQMEPHA